ncbi:hypothetical protein EG346_18480 [Chryseobacterium carnipullorum]|uniref:Quinol oxidase subunit 4 n=1 Tax=Chryseobacterium carnipullorum TaxID=1124835 RepID=A0A1M7NG61_CHRCU|nr:hypothetical protein [Chryseobacterium carnipullorum]AZA50043.1 hypothetical protein EG346_18480 [Chryseobacterium carnipullorum]AZA64920.1 hypothetical protein EG345_09510 [Chryseobacterium carnipullorum]SHN02687.1 hypothetical protein SAMN05444360_1281 [Chryseobacterium carnipullorum]STC96829.1 Uncharacterised protein [Chryseobacterium carnipullorum]HBV17727.1 hypothetical protein [Chryseobacterium carnipullorum]
MKGLIKMAGVVTVLFMMSSCVVHDQHVRRVPPGHAKRMYGGSARYYAPGQVKKRVYYDDNDHRDRHHHKHKGRKHHRD